MMNINCELCIHVAKDEQHLGLIGLISIYYGLAKKSLNITLRR